MHSLQPQQNAQLRPRGHDENILEEAYRGRYARQRLLNFWPESSCGYHAIKRFVCIIQVDGDVKAATDMFRQATISQYLRFDFGAAFHYTAMVGNGLVEAGRPETGLQYCNTILRLTSLVKDLGFPFLAYQGKARALFALDRTAEAKIVLDEAITRARKEGDYMA